jgi:nitrate reductase NapE
MADVSNIFGSKEPSAGASRREEILVFSIIAAMVWPIVAVMIVGGMGFIIWMSQIILGPPGPPPS